MAYDPEVQQKLDDLTSAVNAKSAELDATKTELATVKAEFETLKASYDSDIEKAKAEAAKEGQISILADVKSRCNL